MFRSQQTSRGRYLRRRSSLRGLLSVRARRGSAVTEMAIALPILTFLILGSIQAANLLNLKQALTGIAHAAALQSVKAGAKASEINSQVAALAAARNLTQVTCIIADGGSTLDTLGSGRTFAVTVSANTAANSKSPLAFAVAGTISASVTASKE